MGDGVGAGEENTYIIVGNQKWGSFAAKLCRDLTLGGYTDWYLPSKYELNLMYTNLYKANPPLGNFVSSYYWSSTEAGDDMAYVHNIDNSVVYSGSKYATFYVRAIRAF